MCLHYYSRVAFASLLAPLFRRGPNADSRVLSVLSAGVHSPYLAYATDPDLSKTYSLHNAADAAGFYTDIAMDSLSRRWPNVSFIHAAPGFVSTAWGTEMPFWLRWPIRLLQPLFGVTIEHCAQRMGVALFGEAYRAPGFHLMSADANVAAPTTLHEEAREIVWKNTNDVLTRVLGAQVVDIKHV